LENKVIDIIDARL